MGDLATLVCAVHDVHSLVDIGLLVAGTWYRIPGFLSTVLWPHEDLTCLAEVSVEELLLHLQVQLRLFKPRGQWRGSNSQRWEWVLRHIEDSGHRPIHLTVSATEASMSRLESYVRPYMGSGWPRHCISRGRLVIFRVHFHCACCSL